MMMMVMTVSRLLLYVYFPLILLLFELLDVYIIIGSVLHVIGIL